MSDVTLLTMKARRNASTMSPADAAAKTVTDAIADGTITLTYPEVNPLVRALGTDHPERSQLQVAASSASTSDEFRDIAAKALTAIITTPAFSTAAA